MININCLRILFLSLILVWTFPVAAQLDITDPAAVEAFVDGVVKPIMKKHHSPSGVVMVMKNGETVLAKGYGYIDVEKRIPVDPRTSLFRPGSISKLFTWVAVMQQVEKGVLDLDTDVNAYLDTFQVEDTWPGEPVTLRHIMTHTAGFEDSWIGLIGDDPQRIIPLAESLAKSQPYRVNPPGKHAGYSNWATALAGLIVQNVSGVPFNEYVQRNIFDVLGMEHSTFEEPLPEALKDQMARAYGYRPDEYFEMNYEIVSNFGPAGAAAVSAYDMSLFARALLNGGAHAGRRILQPSTLQQMLNEGFSHDPRVRGTGLGFLKYAYGEDDLAIFGHGGATRMFFSHFGMSLAEDFMFYFSFSGPGGPLVYEALIESFHDEFFPPKLQQIEPPSDFAERGRRFAGTYISWRSSFTGIEALMRAFTGQKVTPLTDNTLMINGTRYVEIGKNLFRELDGNGRVAFQEGENDEVSGFVIDGTGVFQYYRAPFWETNGFNATVVGLSMLVFISVFLRLCYQWREYRQQQPAEKRANGASILVAATNLSFALMVLLALSGGIGELLIGVPLSLKIALIFPILATFAALYHLYQLGKVWHGRMFTGVWPRVRFSAVSLASLAMVWFYYYWNLLGFNYYS